MEITVEFIENLRQSKELFTEITPFQISYKFPIICSNLTKFRYKKMISKYLICFYLDCN